MTRQNFPHKNPHTNYMGVGMYGKHIVKRGTAHRKHIDIF